MTFTDEEELRAWLGATAAVDVAPTLSPEQVSAAISASRVVDAEGRAPVDPGWVATWNGYYAAHLLFKQKATLAVVTNVSDPDKLNRVKCVPVENDQDEETDWCYVMAPMGGKECGQFFFPNVNDLVVLGYLNGDPHRPMVLGAYWNTKVKPPYVIQDGKVYDFTIKMPSGTELHLYDEPGKQKVTLTMPSGTTLTMDDEGKKIALQDKGGENALTMDLQGGNVELKAKTKLTLSAGTGASMVLEASGNVTEKANVKVAVQAATIEEKASAQMTIQGGMVSIN